MSEYTVVWAIQLTADNHEAAARKARAVQMNPNSTADVFEVTHGLAGAEPRRIDLSTLDGRSID